MSDMKKIGLFPLSLWHCLPWVVILNPTNVRLQPRRFVVVTDKEKISRTQGQVETREHSLGTMVRLLVLKYLN